VTYEYYDFEINPSSGGTPGLSKNIVYQSTAAASNKTIVMKRAAEPTTVSVQGTITTQLQLDTLATWAKKRYPINLQDDLDRKYLIYIESFDVRREPSSDTPYSHSYTLTYLIVGFTGPPAKVGTVTATPGDTEVALSWSAPASNLPITDYLVQYSTDDATWSTFPHGTTATTATVTGLANDTLYYFRVAGVNAAGTGPYSDSVTATPTVPFSPLDLSPTLWVDASDTGTITESTPGSGTVSQWDDKSGNGYNLTQGTGTAQPATGTRTINGLNVLGFDGADDRMIIGAFASNLTQPNTIFAVFIPDITTLYYVYDGRNATNRNALIPNGPDSLYAGSSLGLVNVDTVTQVARAVFNGNSSSLHIDGVLKSAGNVGTQSLGGLTVGSRYSYQRFFQGAIAEIIVVDGTLTAQQISDTETYLANKWGITL
jgi:hypothetical protein